jgi:hypothetical protein
MTFQAFNRCLQFQLQKEENTEYGKNQGFIDAIQNVFSNNLGNENKTKKKVSFSNTNEDFKKKKKSNLSKSTTLKSNSSREKFSQFSEEIKFEDFDKFFQIFIKNYAEEGYNKSISENSGKRSQVVHFMNNRESESESEGSNNFIKINCKSQSPEFLK